MRSLQITAAVGAIGVAGYSLLTPAPWTQVYARTCTQPIYYNSAASFTFDVTYTNVSPSGSEMTAFEARTDTAADGWTWEFENRQSQSGIDVSRVGSGGDWQVIIDGNEAADAANIYYGNHTIVLGSNYIDGTYDATRVAADMLHEFGHVLGFDDLGSCTDSIMCNLPWVGPRLVHRVRL